MGTYSSIFIEFKKKDQWHLLEAAVPLTFVDHSYSGMSPDDNHVIEVGGNKNESDVHARAPRGCSRPVGRT